jgi:alpha-glucosidase (family GH31 glycosyl hydrolase)
MVNPDELSITVRDQDNELWELPQRDPYPHDEDVTTQTFLNNKSYEISFNHRPFSFEIIRTATKECIFSTKKMPFFLSRTFTVFGTSKASNRVFGLGERAYNLRIRKGTYTIFTQDNPGCIEDGTPGHGTYGHHPMYLMREKSGNFHILLLRNTVPLDVEVSKHSIIFKMVQFHQNSQKPSLVP